VGLMLPHRTIIYTIRYDIASTQPSNTALCVSKLTLNASTREPFPQPAGIVVNKTK